MATWSELAADAPELGSAGHALLHQFGPGLGYLATVRRDGGPRVHPFCPIIVEPELYGLIGPSPKQRDLFRDGRYAVHSFPSPDRDDEFTFTGRARHETDVALDVARVLPARYEPRGEPDNWPPRYSKWTAPRLRTPGST